MGLGGVISAGGRRENGCGKNEKGAIVDKNGGTEGTLWLQKLKVNQ